MISFPSLEVEGIGTRDTGLLVGLVIQRHRMQITHACTDHIFWKRIDLRPAASTTVNR